MRLVEAEISGFKRFAGETGMDLDADLICIVGPNGAGKTSFLKALVRLNDDEAFELSDRTRVEGGKFQAPMVRAKFVLDVDDREALATVPEASKAREFHLTKWEDGSRRASIEPRPRRSSSSRRDVGSLLDELGRSPWIDATDSDEASSENPPEKSFRDLINDALDLSASSEGTLPDLEPFVQLRDRIDSAINYEENPIPKKYRRLSDLLQKAIEYESLRSPNERAEELMMRRVPSFLLFDPDLRDLRPTYDVNEPANRAVENLLNLAGTNWEELVQVVEAQNRGHKKTYINAAEEELRRRITLEWDQTPLTLGLELDSSVLTILMSMQADDYIEVDQHSDGLRQFVALSSFIALADQEIPPIVLIDEADVHLHYDAQANLVSVLEEQRDAAKVIYTTHSAGCLPRDLGSGVRGIVPIEIEKDGRMVQTDHSEVINGIWESNRGFSPLLIALGANAFAFSAAKEALVTEGFTDSLLLPSLIREATESKLLSYQVVPEFASASVAEVPDFDRLAARVAFLADGDGGGVNNVNKLTGSTVLDAQTLFLGGSSSSGISLEDLINPEVYVRALDQELDRQVPGLTFPLSELKATGRSNAVKKWCEAKSEELGQRIRIGKARVAQRVLEQRKDHKLVDAEHKETLILLDEQVRGIFDKATVELLPEGAASLDSRVV